MIPAGLRSRLTYANVVATVCVFVVLGGTGVAAPVAETAASLGSSVKRALGLAKKADRTATRALRTAKEALARGGPVGPQGPQGPQGEQGQKGDQGEPGPSTGPAGGDLSGTYPNPSLAVGAVQTAELGENQVTPAKLSFDPATEVELDAHKGSGDHDARYANATGDTFTGAVSFSAAPAFQAAGAPFTVASASKVSNLNADQLDGQDSSNFLSTAGGAMAGTLTLGAGVAANGGSAAVPAYRFSSDANTGIFSPGPDQLSLAIGGSAGLSLTNDGVKAGGNYIQIPTITGSPPPTGDCDSEPEAGRLVARTDGSSNLYVCTGATGWVAK